MTGLELDRVDARILLEAMSAGAWAVRQPAFLEEFRIPRGAEVVLFERMRREVRAIAEGDER